MMNYESSQEDFNNEKSRLRGLFREKYTDLITITQADIHKLLWLLDKAFIDHYDNGFLKMYMVPLNSFVAKMIREKGIGYKGLELKVASHYFNGRDAIHFDKNGGVWFCSWAGGNNHVPFLKAFKEWLE